jgi:hypothetical protein
MLNPMHRNNAELDRGLKALGGKGLPLDFEVNS